MRAMKITGAAIAAVIVVIALVLLIGIPSAFMTSAIQDRVERETGYRVVISGATRLGLFPSFNVTAHDVSVRNPNDRDFSSELMLGSVRLDIALTSLLSGHPKVTTLAIDHPVLRMPLLRERARQPRQRAKPASADADSANVDHVVVTDGAVVFANPQDRVETRIEGINADFNMGGDRQIKVSGNAKAGNRPVKFDISATPPGPLAERQNIPVELRLDAPDFLRSQLSAKAQVRVSGSTLVINGLGGTIGNDEFNGWASADLSSKPMVKLDLAFQRLDIGTSATRSPSRAQPWSNAKFDLSGLNYVDAQVRISAASLHIGDAQFESATIDATLAGGMLNAAFSRLGIYGGEAEGALTIDAATNNPAYTLRSDLRDVQALPLLKNLADFDKLDGKMQARIAVQARGASQRAIVSSLGGTVFTNFQDGAIQGLNVARMIRSLTSGTLSGWQESSDQATDLTQLSASFRLEKGQATSSDFTLVGPLVRMTGAGTIDLASKSLAFRVEPKLVMSIQGQGSTSNPVGLGIPVVIEGPWSEPRIYPEMSGILDDPDAAYAKLKEMGKGLFGTKGGANALGNAFGSSLGGPAGGSVGGSAGGPLGDSLGETLGALIQQGLGRQRNIVVPPSASPPDPAQSGRTTQSGAATQGGPATQSSPATPPAADSEAMNGILRDLFNR